MRSLCVKGVTGLVAGWCSLAVSLVVCAGPVITTDNVVVFQSNGFESDAVDAFPSVTTVGSWGTNGEISDAVVKLGNANGIPPASAGDNVLALLRPADPNVSRSIAEAEMAATATNGQIVNASFDLYVNTEPESRHFAISMVAPGGGSGFSRGLNWVGVMSPANAVVEGLSTAGLGPDDWVLSHFTGQQWENINKASDGMPLGLPADGWRNVEMTTTVGSGVFTLSVDGVVSSSTAMRQNLDVSGFLFQQNSFPDYPSFYVDGPTIPEPSALLSLIIGAIGCLSIRWQ